MPPTGKIRPVVLNDGTQLEMKTVPSGWEIIRISGTSAFKTRIDELASAGRGLPGRPTLRELVVSARTRHQPSQPGVLKKGETLFVWRPSPGGGPSEKLVQAEIVSAGAARRI